MKLDKALAKQKQAENTLKETSKGERLAYKEYIKLSNAINKELKAANKAADKADNAAHKVYYQFVRKDDKAYEALLNITNFVDQLRAEEDSESEE